MISSILGALAVVWILFVRSYPHFFTKPRFKNRQRGPVGPVYHYYVCGDDEPMIWRRKTNPSIPVKSAARTTR